MRKTVWIFLLVAYFILLAWVSHVRAPASNVMEADEEVVNYLSRMVCSDETMRNEDGSVTVSEGDVLFGPYLDLKQGNYLVTIESDAVEPFQIVVTADSGASAVTEAMLDQDTNVFSLHLEEERKQVEFVIRGNDGMFRVFSVFLNEMDSVSAGAAATFPSEEDGLTDYMAQMVCSREEMRQTDGSFVLGEGDILYGPYIDVDAGEYSLLIQITCETTQTLRITANSGELLLSECNLANGTNEIPLHFDEAVQRLEFVISGMSNENVTVESVCFG